MPTFNFEVTADPRKHGKPYIAMLDVDPTGRLTREFVQLAQAWGKKTITVYGSYTVNHGQLVERRDSDGSWKNDDRSISICWHNRLVRVADPDASRDIPTVARYLQSGALPHAWDIKITEATTKAAQIGYRECVLGVINYQGEPTPLPEVL